MWTTGVQGFDTYPYDESPGICFTTDSALDSPRFHQEVNLAERVAGLLYEARRWGMDGVIFCTTRATLWLCQNSYWKWP